ncbi:DUF5703 domain-containing protein [Aliifodinibius sp. S!AR15-10]|uniref:DUF5703 domain-containing protein n=1 Tax=Aliifodinibius sp. S!AR15-10 TaxID=2950437 RepID=UPI0028566EDC|nr:DUF5703 domain-containing protein [Aliifodinibius sp. S!AR15-10]MDR8393802.1 DUF5703 domain-containing protein [Aliifodinibius sp. S!AR15-10]
MSIFTSYTRKKDVNKIGVLTTILAVFFLTINLGCNAQELQFNVDNYNIAWDSQSHNSGASMPMVGGNIGTNIWVENDELLFYFSSPGAREENGALMKFGRMRISFEPNIFDDATFKQELRLSDGAVYITTNSKEHGETNIKLWAEIREPVVHTEVESDVELDVTATYENWRTDKLLLPHDTAGHEQRYISWNNLPGNPEVAYIYPDEFEAGDNSMVFYHRMRNEESYFPKIVKQQGLTEVKDQLWDPVTNSTFGGILTGDNLTFSKTTSGHYAQTDFKGWQYETQEPAKSVELKLYTHIAQTETVGEWKSQLMDKVQRNQDDQQLWKKNQAWWKHFWERSHIVLNKDKGPEDAAWRLARNYNLFRYMLVSGFYGKEPTKFNGGVLTFDPKYENEQRYVFKSGDESAMSAYTPDYRRWGAGFHAQNQRLLYWPMLKSGDFDGMLPQLDFYKNTMATTKTKVEHLWGHDGLVCVEAPSATGLLGMAEFGFADERVTGFRHRPKDYEKGVTNNPFIGRLFQSQLEFAFMMLQYREYTGKDVSEYIDFIEQAVIFYDEHYRMHAKQRTGKELDENGKLIIYPTNALEYHPNAKNPTSVIAGMRAVLSGLLELPDSIQSPKKKKRWKSILATLPDYPMGMTSGNQYNRDFEGFKYFKPAENYERNHPSHNPEMYGLYPYQQYGLGMPDLDLQKNTYLFTTSEAYRASSGGWSQSVIHAARLGMADKAGNLIFDKLGNGPFRFPAYFPGGDYAPDHNVGGSGMIGLQEMIMQTHDGKIRIKPALPKEWDVQFKLHAPQETTVEAVIQDGEVKELKVTPKEREQDVIFMDK